MRVYSAVTMNVIKSNDLTNSDLFLADFGKAVSEFCRVMEVSPKIVRKSIADLFSSGSTSRITPAESEALKDLLDFYEAYALAKDPTSLGRTAYLCLNLNTGAQFIWVV